jgi:hypothetical protein
MDDLCGPWIARRFAQEATRSLSQDELAQLLEFLKAGATLRSNYIKSSRRGSSTVGEREGFPKTFFHF